MLNNGTTIDFQFYMLKKIKRDTNVLLNLKINGIFF